MSEMGLADFIAEQEAELKKQRDKVEKKNKSFRKRTFAFVGIFCIIVAGSSVTHSFSNNTYNRILDGQGNIDEIITSKGTLMSPEIYDVYEKNYLGNKSMNSQNYGFFAENQYGYTQIGENGTVKLIVDGTETSLPDAYISQINITNDKVIYKGRDKKIYSVSYDGSDKQVLVEDSVGEALLAGNDLYYTSYSKGGKLCKYGLITGENSSVIEENIKTFTISADTILYLDYDNNLTAANLSDLNKKWINKNVDKFYYNGDIFVQNNGKIIKFNLNNHYPKEIANNITELLGVDSKCVYYSVGNDLYSKNLQSSEKNKLEYSFGYFKGVFDVNNGIVALGGGTVENK